MGGFTSKSRDIDIVNKTMGVKPATLGYHLTRAWFDLTN